MNYYPYEENKYKSGIYIIRCTLNDMVYVGATCSQFRYRKQDHFSKLKNNKHRKQIQSDYNEYGKDFFVFEIVKIESDERHIKDLEIEMIEYYKNMDKCYNIYDGGEVVGTKLSDDTKRKMSESRKGKKLSEYQKKILREYNLNKKLTKEQKENLSHHFEGSKSSLAVLNEDQVYEIKKMLMDGKTCKEISGIYNVKEACIYNIRMNYRWKHVVIEGWDEFQKNLPKIHRITEEEEQEIVEKLKNNVSKLAIHLEYKVSYDKIRLICKKRNIPYK